MATTTFSVPTQWSSDATFRTICSAINTAIVSLGIVQTSDTGQINWTTITKPAAINTYAGYEMYRFNDSLQSTNPVYFKLSYYSNGYSTGTGLLLWIQAGQGTDGAGNLTGNVSQSLSMWCNSSENVTRTSYASGSTNRLAMSLWPTSNVFNYWYIFGIERTHDSAGADTGAGVYMFTGSYGVGGQSQYLPLGTPTTPLPPAVGGGWYCSTPIAGSGVLSGNTYTYPVKVFTPLESLPSLNFLHYLNPDITASTTVSITCYDGTARSYLAGGNAYGTGYLCYANSNITTCLLMRYD